MPYKESLVHDNMAKPPTPAQSANACWLIYCCGCCCEPCCCPNIDRGTTQEADIIFDSIATDEFVTKDNFLNIYQPEIAAEKGESFNIDLHAGIGEWLDEGADRTSDPHKNYEAGCCGVCRFTSVGYESGAYARHQEAIANQTLRHLPVAYSDVCGYDASSCLCALVFPWFLQ